MISVPEFRRLVHEWKVRFWRIKNIVQPPSWTEQEWTQFGRLLLALTERNGANWTDESGTRFWDLRWNLQDGGVLVCQVQSIPDAEVHLVVAQEGGFAATESGSYTWLWLAFNREGHVSREPYFVDGTWKEALMQLMLPYNYQSGFYLAGAAQTPDQLLLENNANPGYHDHLDRQNGENIPRLYG